jgi:hypothetical protein
MASLLVSLSAAKSDSARITQLVNEVSLQPQHGAARTASINEPIADGTLFRTRSDSRLELTFASGSFARLGPVTTVRSDDEHELHLTSGALFLHAAKSAGETRVTSPLVTATTNGATFVFETYKFPTESSDEAAVDHAARYRLSVFEGTVRVTPTSGKGDPIIVEAKQALIGSVDHPLGEILNFDRAAWLQTNVLITGFAPLKSDLLASLGATSNSAVLAALFRPVTAATGIAPLDIGTVNPNNLSAGDNEVSPNEQRLTICHNGQTLTLPVAAAQAHLRNHPRDHAGACH